MQIHTYRKLLFSEKFNYRLCYAKNSYNLLSLCDKIICFVHIRIIENSDYRGSTELSAYSTKVGALCIALYVQNIQRNFKYQVLNQY